ncbi:UDP-GalNAc:beta-1,3-N-acetylgalactosaminyltransferase 1-like isoform X2 [Bradysia coprophila]|uniref:UDP-GalNAc:beta-1, 3-N-acetylgalactosaminyltransferase 1-like isoform X2 n=1 Tax=Bradysia coprophila TaxID=38358 RepID=UPI00187DB4F1|nr:UDP-GalNAc:beta-1,3-N-acetylgalactosaminyltransferase 1-like isoform X2 [Bradysia coprophila]
MRLLPTRVPLKLTTKWKLLFLILTAAVVALTTIFICSYPPTNVHVARRSPSTNFPPPTQNIPHRPKTLLIYNNEQLCSSNTSQANMYNQHRHSWPTKPSASKTDPAISIVIVVPSRRNNFMQRRLIRQTYGSVRQVNNVNILAVVFVLGSDDDPKDSPTDPNALNVERLRFDDIIVGDLVDTYRSLSRKTIMTYDWLTSYCSEADLVLKTDDDVMVDIFKLTAELGKWTPAELQSFKFWCGVHSPETIERNPESIYYVSPAEYGREKFPKHCAGVGYVATMHVIRLIADEISKSFLGPICTHEDVFMTGIVPEKINSDGHEPPIERVNKIREWIFYIDENNPNVDGHYIWIVSNEAFNKPVDFDEFRQRSGTRVFYLLQHDVDFEWKFMRLWYLVVNSFRHEEATIKSDIE